MNSYQSYNQGFGNMYNQGNATLQQGFKQHIGTEEIRDIVAILNQKPFSENLSLVSFDELSTLELLELLNKVLCHLDKQHQVNIKEELQETTATRISEFLRILNYPSNFDLNWQTQLVQGDKRIIYPILYFILPKFSDMEKRAYLANYLVPTQIPEEFAADQDIKNLQQQYKDLQAEFQVIHQQYEGASKDAMSPNDLRREIGQLEQEREQLISKINIFKNKNTNRPEFQALLEVTNLLRREQEEEARLSDKIRTERAKLEISDQNLLERQQRLIDAKKTLSNDNSPEEMLEVIRSEVKKNRDLCNERLAYEIQDKRKKLEHTEIILSEPSVSKDQLIQLENQVLQLQREVSNMDDKLRSQQKPSNEDPLAIYKQQASLVTKKKERVLENLKKNEDDLQHLENQIQKKEQELQKLKGPGYRGGQGDFNNYAKQLKDKTQKFKKMKDELKLILTEKNILLRTQSILEQQKEQYDKLLKQSEQSKGITGYSSKMEQLEKVSEQKGQIDEMKEKTLEEISKIVTNIENQLRSKKTQLQPQITDLKNLRKDYSDIEAVYKEKKQNYENVTAGIQSENSALEAEIKQLKEEVNRDDTKLTVLKNQSQLIDLKIQRLNKEAEYQSGKASLNQQYKSYKDWYQQKIAKQEADLKELKQNREVVKENHEPSIRQMKMFNDLNQLLKLKLSVLSNQSQNYQYKGEKDYDGNVNRLVLRD